MRISNGREVEEVKQIKYLGLMMNAEGTCEDEIDTELVLRLESLGQ